MAGQLAPHLWVGGLEAKRIGSASAEEEGRLPGHARPRSVGLSWPPIIANAIKWRGQKPLQMNHRPLPGEAAPQTEVLLFKVSVRGLAWRPALLFKDSNEAAPPLCGKPSLGVMVFRVFGS
jgi:hypothetical protein